MKNSRLFEILYLLVEKRAVTAGELAERLEVSERTIYRDIDSLSAAGIPVFTQKGQGGGIRLMEQFVLDRALLSQEEQDEILFALQATQTTGGTEEDTLARLSALFRRESGGWLEVDFTDWGSGAAERENFTLVKRSVLARRPLSFTYYSSAGEKSRRTVEPARLVFKGGSWYLSAFCRMRQDWRIFRLVRMEDLTLEEGSCPPRCPPQPLDAPPPGGDQGVRLRLRFAPSAAWRVRDYFHPNQITPQPDGCLLVNCAFPEDRWLLSFLLSFGSQMEVLSPVYWREILTGEIKKHLAVYETGQTLSGFREYSNLSGGGKGPAQNQDQEGLPMEERKFCQSCGMPLDKPEDAGTEAGGSPSGDYCRYCYRKGAFTAPEATMDDMIAFNLKFNAENGYPFGPQEEAEKQMRSWFPTLKRWKNP